MITVAVCGCGARGLFAYMEYAKRFPDRMKVVAGADIIPERLQLLRELYGVPEEMCFDSDEALLAQPKLADAMLISTMDRQHAGEAMKALEKGYHLILEKPISPVLAECLALQEKIHETDRFVVVGHVLRYTNFYAKAEELIRTGAIGKLMTIAMTENVGWWHFSHSFVRGNWRRDDETSPMLLQKCCHDMDIMRWLAGVPCKKVQCFGTLSYFKEVNAPEGSAARCMDCPLQDSCRFSAKTLYISSPHLGVRHDHGGWARVFVPDPTEENILEALKTSPYGRCVFRSDNNVADHETVDLEFENGILGTFTVSAFTERCDRTLKITGTDGEIYGVLGEDRLHLVRFGAGEEVIDLKKVTDGPEGHGGGDMGLADGFWRLMTGQAEEKTSVDVSIESHVMALAAEASREAGGTTVVLEDFVKQADKGNR